MGFVSETLFTYMKDKNKFKNIIKYLLCIPLCLGLFFHSAYAEDYGNSTTGNGTSSYGSFTYNFSNHTTEFSISLGIGLSIPIPTGSSFTLHYNFKDTYTGYVQFTITTNSAQPFKLSDCYMTVDNGYFNSSYLPNSTLSSSSKQFRVYVYNATYFEFTIATSNIYTFNPSTSPSVGSFGYGLTDVADVPEIYTKLANINDVILPGMSTSLSNIQYDIHNIEQTIGSTNYYGSLTEAIENIALFVGTDLDNYLYDIDNYLSLLSLLNDNTTGVGYLQEIYTAINNLPSSIDYSSYFIALAGYALNIDTNLSDVETTLNNIYSRLTSINTSVTSISTSLQSSLHTNLDIPRWQLPAYRWALSVSYTSGQYSSWSMTTSTGWMQRYTNSEGDRAFTSNKATYLAVGQKYVFAWASPTSGSGHDIYWTGFSSPTLPPNINVQTFYGSTTNGGYRDSMYYNYIIISNNYESNSSTIGVEIEFTSRRYISPIYVGPYSTMPMEAFALLGLSYVSPETNELKYIGEEVDDISDKMNTLIDAINTLSNAPDVTTQTTINNYETTYNTIHNVETNIMNSWDTYNNNLNTYITNNNPYNDNHNFTSKLYSGKNFIEFMYTEFSQNLIGFHGIVFTILIGVVLLCFLG